MRQARHLARGRSSRRPPRKPFGFLPHYPGPGPGRRLHPGRAALPRLAAARVRLLRAADRRRGRGQRDDAQLRAAEDRATRSTTAPGRSRARGSCCSASPTRPTSPTRASRPASRCCASSPTAAADVRYCDPHIPALELDERDLRGRRRGAPRRSRAADCVVMLTAHREFLDERHWEGAQPRRGHPQRDPARARTSSRSERHRDAADPRRRLHRRGRGGARARARARRSCSPTTGARPAREQLDGLERGRRARWRPPTSATARRSTRCWPAAPRRVLLLAAQASRPISEREPDYTEQTNLTGARRVAEAVAASAAAELVHGSSLHVYGEPARGRGRARTRPTASRATSRTSRRSTRSSRSACTRAAAASGSPTAGSGSSTARARSSTTRPTRRPSIDKFRRLGRGRRAADARRRRPRDDRRRPRRRRGAAAARLPGARAGRDRRLQPRRRDADRRRRRRARRGPRAGRRRRRGRSRRSWTTSTRVAGYLGAR